MDLFNLNPSTMSTLDLVNARFEARGMHEAKKKEADKANDFMELSVCTATMKAYREVMDKIDKQLGERGTLF